MTARQERLRLIADLYEAWEEAWEDQVTPDPQLAVEGPSQYPETYVVISADADAQAQLAAAQARA